MLCTRESISHCCYSVVLRMYVRVYVYMNAWYHMEYLVMYFSVPSYVAQVLVLPHTMKPIE